MNEENAPIKPRRRWLWHTIIILIAAALVLAGYAYLTRGWMPRHLERSVAEALAAELEIPAGAVRVVAADFSGAEVVIAPNAGPRTEMLNISKIIMRYHPVNLLFNREIKVREMEFPGLSLRLTDTSGEFKLNGENLSKLRADLQAFGNHNLKQRIKITGSTLELKEGGKTLLLPLEAELLQDGGAIILKIEVVNHGVRHHLVISIDPVRHETEIAFNSAMPLEHLREMMEFFRGGAPLPLQFSGTGNYSGKICYDDVSNELKSVEFDGKFEMLSLQAGTLRAGSFKDAPVILRLVRSGNKYNFNATGLHLTAPVAVELLSAEAGFDPQSGNISASCGFRVLPEAFTAGSDAVFGRLPLQNGQLNVNWHWESGKWEATLSQFVSKAGESSRQFLLKSGKVLISGSLERLELSAKGINRAGEFSATGTSSDTTANYEQRALFMPGIEFNASGKFNLADELAPFSAIFSFNVKQAVFSGRDLHGGGEISGNGKYASTSQEHRFSVNLQSPLLNVAMGDSVGNAGKIAIHADVTTGKEGNEASFEFSTSNIDWRQGSEKYAGRDLKVKTTVKMTADKNRQMIFADRVLRFNAQTIEFSAPGKSLVAEKPAIKFRSDSDGWDWRVLNHIILAESESLRTENGNTVAELWNAKLESVFQPASAGKRILRVKLETGKTGVECASGKLVAAGTNLIFNSDLKPNRTTPDFGTVTLKMSSLWWQYGVAKFRAGDFKWRGRCFFAPSADANGMAALNRIESDFDLSELHGEVGRLNWDAPAMEGDGDFHFTSARGVIPASVVVQLAGKNLSGNLDQNEFCLDALKINCNGQTDDDGNFLTTQTAKANAAALKTNLFTIDLPQCKLSGQSINLETFAGNFTAEGGNAEIPDYRFALNGIEGKIPLALPDLRAGGNGEISVAKIIYNKQEFGSAKTELEFSDTGIIFQLSHAAKLIPGMTVACLGQIFFPFEPFKLELDVTIPEFNTGKNLALRQIFPSITEDIDLQGTFAAHGNLKIDGGSATGNMDYTCRNANVRRGNLTIRNVNCTGVIEDLLNLRSAAHQNLRFEQLTYPGITIQCGSLNFELERPGVWLIENGRAETAGGTCHLLAPTKFDETKGMEAELFCRGVIPSLLPGSGTDASGEKIDSIFKVIFSDGKIQVEPATKMPEVNGSATK